MERENSNRSRRITLRLTPQEYAKIEQRYKNSTCRKLSDYVRKHLFNKPITTHYRNQSIDDSIEEIVLLRSELSAVGNNVNQVVKKMHTIKQIPEFREWITRYELERMILSNKINDIQNHIYKISDKWLQS
ncbi:plasmid mobilization relaxosome protein MobC [Flavobacterium cupreum]|uniref:Plasmid mobilization relaxosome protein MobC n=1 Tax=Flavobacterium cupreum TaxID=2133766 RepID=A0A434A556_9FLAO|nr:plasmid mobilization relaxosome protein MobC [Flavobacterium cupreum]RUT69472.1 plasmid mobilization relaxosome protein MobC [Flavobacterium cupreum]